MGRITVAKGDKREGEVVSQGMLAGTVCIGMVMAVRFSAASN